MSLFNAQVNAIGLEVQKPEDENHLIVSIDLGMILPIAAPGSQQPLVVPSGKISFPISKDAAESFSKQISDLSEQLAEVSKIEVATDLGAVEQAAEELQRFRNGDEKS